MTQKHRRLTHPDWSPDVRAGINALLDTYGLDGEKYRPDTYAVFDFDNTCSVFDVEEQLAVYQLQTMRFAIRPEELSSVLLSEIPAANVPRYADWLADITASYVRLWSDYGPFTAAGVDAEKQKTMNNDPWWMEFAAKMRALYDEICHQEDPRVTDAWITYWFTGMTEQQVYALAEASHRHYAGMDTAAVLWESPRTLPTRLGTVSCRWMRGVQVPEAIRELWSTLKDNGIHVWVCSASFTDVIRAAVDVWGLHEYCAGVLAMTDKRDGNGIYISEYDEENGCGWLARENGTWERMKAPTKARTNGTGKVLAIANAVAPRYGGHGPIAGFMDSAGDFAFCTEFSTLKTVVCFNRAARGAEDGGGLIAALALYQRDGLGLTLADTDAAGDTLYLLQGRDENGKRTLRPFNSSLVYGEGERCFKNGDSEDLIRLMTEQKMTAAQVINSFTEKNRQNGLLSGCGGYHSHL